MGADQDGRHAVLRLGRDSSPQMSANQSTDLLVQRDTVGPAVELLLVLGQPRVEDSVVALGRLGITQRPQHLVHVGLEGFDVGEGSDVVSGEGVARGLGGVDAGQHRAQRPPSAG